MTFKLSTRLSFMIFAALMLGAGGCGAPEPTLPSGNWLHPEDRIEWRRARLLAALAFPLDADPESLRIELNGVDRTIDFLPTGLFSRSWSERLRRDLLTGEPFDPAEEAPPVDATFETDDMARVRRTHRRALAILDAADLREGENRLVATFRDEKGRANRAERRFRFRPGERTVRFRVTRTDRHGTDRGGGARIILVPQTGAPPVNLSPFNARFLIPRGGQPERSFTLTRGGEATVFLPPGTYRAIATGGPLDGIAEWTVPEHGDASHEFVITREVELPGTVSVDFHVHAAASHDSIVSLEDRVWSFVAAGVDALVASDHHHVTDYTPVIARLEGVPGRLVTIPGVETGILMANGDSLGHWNIWPLHPDPAAPPARPGQFSGYGALPIFKAGPPGKARATGVLAPEMYEAYRRQAHALAHRDGIEHHGVDPAVVQLNHPRGMHFNPERGPITINRDFFNKVKFDPEIPIPPVGGSGTNALLVEATAGGTTALDFDALEIWNRESASLYLVVRRDWFSLLNQGYVRTGVANTDTHSIAPELAGYPMNVVFLEPGEPDGAGVRPEDLARAVRAGRVVGTDGPVPLLTVRAGGVSGSPGDLLAAPDGRVSVEVEVRAASWVPLGSIRIWGNGSVLCHQQPPEDELARPRRMSCTPRLTQDAWILAEVGDPGSRPDGAPHPGLYGVVSPRAIAVGYTNPVLVDVDGNGRFDAPGLEQADLPPRVDAWMSAGGPSGSKNPRGVREQ